LYKVQVLWKNIESKSCEKCMKSMSLLFEGILTNFELIIVQFSGPFVCKIRNGADSDDVNCTKYNNKKYSVATHANFLIIFHTKFS